MQHTTIRRLVVIAGALAAIPLAAGPATARPDPGPALPAPTAPAFAPVALKMTPPTPGHCLLERVGTQLVRCDDLTGNGVPAPGYIPER